MNREEFKAEMLKSGWQADRFGHLQKVVSKRLPDRDYPVGEEPIVTREYRLKLQANSVRYEVKVRYKADSYSPARSEWVRIGGGYYKQIARVPDGRILVGSTFLGEKVSP